MGGGLRNIHDDVEGNRGVCPFRQSVEDICVQAECAMGRVALDGYVRKSNCVSSGLKNPKKVTAFACASQTLNARLIFG